MQRFWRENWMKECRDILTLNWKTSLLMKVHSHCWLRTALQWVQCIFIILWKYLNKHLTEAAALIWGGRLLTFLTPCAALNWGRRLFGGGAYSRKYGIFNLWGRECKNQRSAKLLATRPCRVPCSLEQTMCFSCLEVLF